MYPAPIIPTLTLSIVSLSPRQNLFSGGVCLACKLERISCPVFRTEDLDACNFVVTNASERRYYFAQGKNSESRKQPVSILKLVARKIFSVVDMKDLNELGIERFNHFQSRAARVKMKTVYHESEVFTIDFANDLCCEVKSQNAAIRLAQELESQRDVVRCGYFAKLSQNSRGFL